MNRSVTDTIELESPDDVALAERMKSGRDRIVSELRKLIVGQDDVVHEVLLTLFVGGNSLIVGVPGLAKTLLIHTLARVLDLKFNRIQFTPDLMPSDITGTDIIQEDTATGKRQMVFAPGPIFANIVLADEINRTPPKTQSALLEAMQEHRVTIQGRTYKLEEPFYVFATQNPIELEGTYPLPEAQLDRFMFHIIIDHPPEDEEFEVVRTTTAIIDPKFERTVTGEDLIAFQRLVRRVPVAEPVMRYALNLVEYKPLTDPGPLYETDTDGCCAIRKVEPMQRALGDFDAWVSGVRRDQGPTRANTEVVEHHLVNGRPLAKVYPLAYWTRGQIWGYLLDKGIPYNPLLDQGYSSLGCWPCTRATRAGEDERAGRWAGSGKTECGLHTFTTASTAEGTA